MYFLNHMEVAQWRYVHLWVGNGRAEAVLDEVPVVRCQPNLRDGAGAGAGQAGWSAVLDIEVVFKLKYEASNTAAIGSY